MRQLSIPTSPIRRNELVAHSIWLLGLVALYASAANAEIRLERAKLSAPVRHDYRYDFDTGEVVRDRLQYQVGLSFLISLAQGKDGGEFQFGGLIGTGNGYTSPWNTVANFNNDESGNHQINVRQIYAQWEYERWRTQLGVIPPVKGKVSETSLDKDGWIRGGRLIMPVRRQGQFELVVGTLDSLDDPNAFQPWAKANYYEVEWTHDWSKGWRTELGGVRLDKDRILRGELRYTATIFGARTELAGEVLRNVQSRVWAHDWSIAQRLGSVTLMNEYAYVPKELGLLGALSNDFFTFGHLWVLGVKGPLSTEGGLYWFGRNYLGEVRINFKLGVGYSVGF